MYEELILGRIDKVVVFHPDVENRIRKFRRRNMPADLPISFQKGEGRFEYNCTPAQGVTPEMVKKRASGIKRDPMITTIEVKHDGVQVFVSFSGFQPEQYADEFEYYFWAADRRHVQQVAVDAIKQLPHVVSPSFVIPTMPRFMRPIFFYALHVAPLIRAI